MILLFDIDGTLLSCGGAGRRALERAFHEVLDASDAFEGVRFAGRTDPLILEDGVRSALGRAPTAEDPISELMDSYLGFLEDELARDDGLFSVLEGALDLLERLAATEQFVVGLATGNVERGARLKLKHGALDHFFDFGGFGSDAVVRPDMVRVAIDRGQARARERWGRELTSEQVFVIGDTEHDVTAARAHGVRTVGVLTGAGRYTEALVASQPDVLAESLADPALWSAFGLPSG